VSAKVLAAWMQLRRCQQQGHLGLTWTYQLFHNGHLHRWLRLGLTQLAQGSSFRPNFLTRRLQRLQRQLVAALQRRGRKQITGLCQVGPKTASKILTYPLDQQVLLVLLEMRQVPHNGSLQAEVASLHRLHYILVLMASK
jgi:hypothetical protein